MGSKQRGVTQDTPSTSPRFRCDDSPDVSAAYEDPIAAQMLAGGGNAAALAVTAGALQTRIRRIGGACGSIFGRRHDAVQLFSDLATADDEVGYQEAAYQKMVVSLAESMMGWWTGALAAPLAATPILGPAVIAALKAGEAVASDAFARAIGGGGVPGDAVVAYFVDSQRRGLRDAQDEVQRVFDCGEAQLITSLGPSGVEHADVLLGALESVAGQAHTRQFDEILRAWCIYQASVAQAGALDPDGSLDEVGALGSMGTAGVLRLDVRIPRPQEAIQVSAARLPGLTGPLRLEVARRRLGQLALPTVVHASVLVPDLGLPVEDARASLQGVPARIAVARDDGGSYRNLSDRGAMLFLQARYEGGADREGHSARLAVARDHGVYMQELFAELDDLVLGQHVEVEA